MVISRELKDFISAHLSDAPEKLLLSASRYPHIDIRLAAEQIQARQQVRLKLPSWYTNPELVFPSRLSAEQCSSELTANYKSHFMLGNSFCDLTGGLGVDTLYFARKSAEAYYIERFPDYCEAARHNFSVWGAKHIHVLQADSREIAGSLKADTFYADPARRAIHNQRVFALADCEPDILQLKDKLLQQASRLIIKISPMADIEETLRLLPETEEIHILSVKNECKELVYILGNKKYQLLQDVRIHATELHPSLEAEDFVFTLQEEKNAALLLAGETGKYIYEPHAALMKSGAFKLIASRLGIKKLHKHSHLYTSDDLCPYFPGRSFAVDHVIEFSGKTLKTISKKIPNANLSTRNFPLTVAEIRQRSHLKEGGETYIFATTLHPEKKIFIIAHKVRI